MATAGLESLSLSDNFLIKLNQCRADVDALFNEIHAKLADRQTELLAELDRTEKRYNDSNRAEENYSKLKTWIDEQKTCLENLSNLIGAKARRNTQTGIKETEFACYNWKAQIEVFSNISFTHNTTDLTSSINQLGAITISVAPDYTNRTVPLVLCDAACTGYGEMKYPVGLALDADDNIYITDFGNDKILVFSISGEFIREFGQEYLDMPCCICINNNNIYVGNHTSHSIVKCNITGELITKMGSKGRNNNQFYYPRGIEYYNGLLYICDNNRIQIINEELIWQQYIRHGKIKYPYDIKIREDTIYVSSSDSFYISAIQSLHILSIAGNYIRTLSHQFNFVFYFTLDSYNNIIMSNSNNTITILSLLNNTIICTIKNRGTRGVAITTANKIVNVCTGNNARVQLY